MANKYLILLVEDESNIASFITTVLRANQYEVKRAATGEEALMMASSYCPDLIILDPPRDGIHPKALDKIIDFGVDRMVYISCKPTSLARDLVVLQAGGYTAKRICCVDMFPATTGIETVCLLEKQKSADE